MHGGPYAADWTRWSAQREYASAAESRARELGAGCSAGRSACPWPRGSPRCVWHRFRPLTLRTTSVGSGLAAGRRVPQTSRPGSQPYRRLSGDCLRVLMCIRLVKPGLPQRTHSSTASGSHQTLWKHPLSAALPYTVSRGSHHEPRRTPEESSERLAAEQKTVSFGQCRSRLERRSTTKRGWRIDSLPGRPTQAPRSAKIASRRR